MGNQAVIVEVNEGIMSLTLNRPESLNAYNQDIYEGMIEAFERAKQDEAIRVIVLKGAGRSFCAGGDLKGMSQNAPFKTYETLDKLTNLMITMAELDQPIISVVHGYAAGVGVSLALACDQVFVAEDGKFVLSYSRVGLHADGGGHFFLTRAVGPYRAKELLYTAEPIDARTAYEYGMVNKIVPAEKLQDEVMNYARKLADGPRRAYGMMKKLVNKSLVSDLKTILDMERTSYSLVRLTEDHQEGVAAFKEKRDPVFKGK